MVLNKRGLAVAVILLVLALILVIISLTRKEPLQPSLVARVNIILHPGDVYTLTDDGTCNARSNEQNGVVTVRCPAFTPTPTAQASRTPTVPVGSTDTPTIAPSRTPRPTSTPTPGTASGHARFEFNANLWSPALSAHLRPGDIPKGQSIRATPAVALADSVFVANCLNRLMTIPAVTAHTLGLEGSCDLSSWRDAQTYAADPRFPAWVTWLEYDYEGGMSPSDEWSAPVPAVTAFSKYAHAAGKKVIWAPVHFIFDKALADGDLAQILQVVDGVAIQYQKSWTTLPQFLTDVSAYHQYVRAHGAALLAVQMGFGFEDCATQVAAFRQGTAEGILEIDASGTHNDAVTVACVATGLRP